jgi:hypothetical protein
MVFNNMQWPIQKTLQVICDALQDYDRIEWKHTLVYLEKAPNVAYQNILHKFNSTWGVIDLSNSMVTWKVRPHMGIIFYFPSVCVCYARVVVFGSFLAIDLNQFVPKTNKQTNKNTYTCTHTITFDNMYVLVNVYSSK